MIGIKNRNFGIIEAYPVSTDFRFPIPPMLLLTFLLLLCAKPKDILMMSVPLSGHWTTKVTERYFGDVILSWQKLFPTVNPWQSRVLSTNLSSASPRYTNGTNLLLRDITFEIIQQMWRGTKLQVMLQDKTTKQVVWAALALIFLFNSIQRRNLDHCLRSGVYTLLFAPLSDLSATATLHILWLALVADGNSLLYIYVDLLCNINRFFFFPSAD